MTKGNSSCSKELYHLMVHCWASEPNKRPTASKVYTFLLKWSPSENNATQLLVMKPLSLSPGNVSLKSSETAIRSLHSYCSVNNLHYLFNSCTLIFVFSIPHVFSLFIECCYQTFVLSIKLASYIH